MAAKCPKCEKVVPSVNIKTVDGRAGMSVWKTVLYTCPFCFTILSAGIDPIAIKSDIVAELKKR